MAEQLGLALEPPAITVVGPDPVGLPPRRLDVCDACQGDGEVAPRRREFYRHADGRLLCRACKRGSR